MAVISVVILANVIAERLFVTGETVQRMPPSEVTQWN